MLGDLGPRHTIRVRAGKTCGIEQSSHHEAEAKPVSHGTEELLDNRKNRLLKMVQVCNLRMASVEDPT